MVAGAAFIFGAAGAPVLGVVAVVVGGYILAATVVDLVDEIFDIKGTVAGWAR